MTVPDKYLNRAPFSAVTSPEKRDWIYQALQALRTSKNQTASPELLELLNNPVIGPFLEAERDESVFRGITILAALRILLTDEEREAAVPDAVLREIDKEREREARAFQQGGQITETDVTRRTPHGRTKTPRKRNR